MHFYFGPFLEQAILHDLFYGQRTLLSYSDANSILVSDRDANYDLTSSSENL